MNKKFSTIAASMLLATAVGTVSAQSASGDVTYFSKSEAPALNTVATVTDGRAYQLSNGHHVLVMKKIPDGKAGFYYRLAFVPFGEANLGESLWIIETDDENSSSVNGPAFRFRNLAHNYCISYDIAKVQQYDGPWEPTNLGGKAVAWSWMRSTSGGDLTIGRTPEAYFDKDSVMTLIPLYDKGGEVAAVKYAAKDVRNKVSQLQIRPYEAGPVWLNKSDLNTLLQTQEEDKQVMFHFAKGTSTENLWDQKPYTAVDAKGKNTLSYGAVADAKQEAEDAYQVYLEKLEDLEKALTDLKNQKAEVAETAEELQVERENYDKLVKELLSIQVDLRSENSKLTDYKAFLQSVEEAIINNSTANEKIKRDVAALLRQLGVAEDDYMEAALTYKELDEKYWDAKDDHLTAEEDYIEILALKNAAYEQYRIAKLFDNALTNGLDKLTTISWDMFHPNLDYEANRVAWDNLFAAIQTGTGEVISESDRLLFVEYAQKIYTDIQINGEGYKEDPIYGSDGQTIVGYNNYLSSVAHKLQYDTADDLKELEDDYNGLAEKTEEALKEAETALNTANELLRDSQAALEERDRLEKEKNEIEQKCQSRINDLELSETADKDLLKRKSQYESIIAETEKTITELEGKEEELKTSTTASISRQLDLSDKLRTEIKVDLAYYWREWTKAKCIATNAFYTHKGLYAVWKHLDAFKTPHWLSLMTADNKYLMVDTAYVNNNEEVAGINHLRFNVAAHDEDFVNVNAPLSARDINGRFNFRFLYFPTQDSLRIEADGFNQKDVTTKYWKNRSDNEIRLHSSIVPGRENNLVKVAVLGGHREVTVGSAERVKVSNNFLYTINDCIGLKITPASDPITLDPGLYYMDLISSSNSHENGARLMADLDGTLTKIAPAAQGKMEFAHMPAAKWYVEEKPSDFGGYPGIFNLETEAPLNNFAYKVEQRNDSSFVSISYNYQGQTNVVGDFVLTKAPESEEGYYRADTKDPRDIYTLNYLNITPGLNVEVGSETVGNDSVLVVANSDGTKFKLHRTAVEKYGMGKKLSRGIYKLSVNDPDKLTMNNRYVKITTVDGTEQVVVVTDAKTATEFYLKEINHDPETDMHYYALIDKAVDKKLGVVGATGLIEAEDITAESETSAFALLADTTRYYREFTAEELGENNVMKFYRVNSNKEYLYFGENNLLEVEGKEDNAGDLANMTVVPTTEPGVLMPQYLIVRNAEMKKGEIIPCGEEHATEEEMLACQHTTIVDDSLKGLFLVNTRVDEELYKSTLWENKYTRLAFVEGHSVKSVVDSTSTFDWIALETGDTIQLAGNKHNPAKFEFRLINENEEQDFLIESESWKGEDAFGGEARPLGEKKGGWLKIQNGVPVIVSEEFEAAVQSDIYNVETSEIDDPTANDEISTSEVTVIAGNGQITINGAAGKKVVVSNILGQVVANTVLTSDNATIAAPQGVVVVAVEGEEAVKAIVK